MVMMAGGDFTQLLRMAFLHTQTKIAVYDTYTEEWERTVCLNVWHVEYGFLAECQLLYSSHNTFSACAHFGLPLPCFRSGGGVLHVFRSLLSDVSSPPFVQSTFYPLLENSS